MSTSQSRDGSIGSCEQTLYYNDTSPHRQNYIKISRLFQAIFLNPRYQRLRFWGHPFLKVIFVENKTPKNCRETDIKDQIFQLVFRFHENLRGGLCDINDLPFKIYTAGFNSSCTYKYILKNQETPVEKNIRRRKMHGKNEYLVLYTHNTGSSIWIEPILDIYCGFFNL